MKQIIQTFLMLILLGSTSAFAQDSTVITAPGDTTDLISSLDKTDPDEIVYTKATFKTTRLINGHSVETLEKAFLTLKYLIGLGR